MLNDDLRLRLSKIVKTSPKLIYYFGYDEKVKQYKVVFHEGTHTYKQYIDLKSIYTKKYIRAMKVKKLMNKLG